MNPNKQSLLLLCRIGTDFIWRYAWTFFLSLSILGRPISLLEPAVTYTVAYLVGVYADNRAWRVFQWIAIHIAGFVLIWFWAIYRFFYSPAPGLDSAWIVNWFVHLQELHFFFIQFLFFVCLLPFWMGARAMVKRADGYLAICLQFDKGLGLFFLLLLVKFMAQEKGGLFIEEQTTRCLVFAYFAFGLTAIGLSRKQNGMDKRYRSGYHGIGVILGFLSMVLIAGGVLTSVLLPSITHLADSAQSTLKGATEPMIPVFEQMVRFIFSAGRYRREVGTSLTDGSDYQAVPGNEMVGHHGLGGVLIGMLGLVALGMIGYLVYWLTRWFLKRRRVYTPKVPAAGMIQGLISMMAALFLRWWHGFLSLWKSGDDAAAVYAKLLRWGRRSGLPVRLTETPREYGNRLSRQLPELMPEIDMIIEAFNRETYGDIEVGERVLSRLLAALRTLQSPRFWGVRFKVWYFRTSPFQHLGRNSSSIDASHATARQRTICS